MRPIQRWIPPQKEVLVPRSVMLKNFFAQSMMNDACSIVTFITNTLEKINQI